MKAEPFVQHDNLFRLDSWNQQYPGLTAGITSRHNGFSGHPYLSLNLGFHVGDNPDDVLTNRESISGKIGVSLEHWVGTEQVHQSVIKKIRQEDAGKGAKDLQSAIQGTDGIYTAEENILLTSLYADCVPLFFMSPVNGLIGLAHAGWKGTVGHIGSKMIEKWVKDEGVQIEDIFVAIGPSISDCCYEVDKRVIDQVKQALPVATSNLPYHQVDDEHFMLNLREVNKQILVHCGIREENITETSFCTSCQNEHFFSHRKEQGKTGRIMSYIGRLKGVTGGHPEESLRHSS